ncbi:uncharacterized protein PgNI_07436 [Pyricularia grisea]|uniref:Zn(2)-C6 fungal-type domain-containing protein n=1 Tax=Pyricularia grisea TaxID=148305 RepID=A0A6P8B0R5_PYRGI|nr:uncharacterized protein PgNI_07436 [Pyricularia grisea]TLD08424.1 hypothetical protein PgNI_07436 [Pyricularia grisea]
MENHQSPPPTVPKRKRKRLNFACNHCRERKIRCDEGQPSCHSCLAAGIPCVTTDKRRPGAEVERRTAGSPRQIHMGSKKVTLIHVDEIEPLHGPARFKRVRTLSPALSTYSDDTDHLTPVSATPGDVDDNNLLPPSALDPPAEDESGRYGGLLPLVPRLRDIGTLETLTGWLDLAFYRLGVHRRLRAGLGGSESGTEQRPPVVLSLVPPALPALDLCHATVNVYFSTINQAFPILDLPTVRGWVGSASKSGSSGPEGQTGDIMSILQLRLVLVLGSLNCHGTCALESEQMAEYVSYCQSMLGHVLSTRSLEAVQYVLMLAIALGQRDQISSSWHITTLCVSMAQSMGLHRRRKPSRQDPSPVDEQEEELRRRTWWSIYSFEKLFAFEFGRPSSIRDSDCDQAEPVSLVPASSSQEGGWSFRILTSFARLLSQINDAGIRSQSREERTSPGNFEVFLRRKLKLIGKSMYLLTRWAETVPDRMRPRFDLMCSRDEYPLASFISIHYNNALMLLSRNSFLVSTEAIRKTVEMYTAGKPWSSIMENGSTVAANAARTMIKMLVDGHEQGAAPVLSTLAPSLHAVYVLAIHLLAMPGSRLASWDLDHGVDYVKRLYDKHHSDKEIHRILESLMNLVDATIQAAKPKTGSQQTNNVFSGEASRSLNRLPTDNELTTVDQSNASVTAAVPLQSAPAADSLRTEPLEMTGGVTGNTDVRDSLWPVDTASDMGWGWDDFGQVFDLNFGGSIAS